MRNSKLLSALLLLTLSLRALVPAGYMPGSLDSGDWMVLCPTGSAAAWELIKAADPHADHGHHAEGATEAGPSVDDSCQIGKALAMAIAPLDERSVANIELSYERSPVIASGVFIVSRHWPAHRSRAPPLS